MTCSVLHCVGIVETHDPESVRTSGRDALKNGLAGCQFSSSPRDGSTALRPESTNVHGLRGPVKALPRPCCEPPYFRSPQVGRYAVRTSQASAAQLCLHCVLGFVVMHCLHCLCVGFFTTIVVHCPRGHWRDSQSWATNPGCSGGSVAKFRGSICVINRKDRAAEASADLV